MSLHLTPAILDRSAGAPPLITQLADHLRQLIVSRDLEPGAELPGELAIAADTGLSRSSAREALKVLVSEGLLERRAGAATRVAGAGAAVRRMAIARYRQQVQMLAVGNGSETRFVTDHDAAWSQFTVMPCEVTKESATAQDAHFLKVRKGSSILRRRFVKRIDSRPLEIQRSAIPYKLAGRTALADASRYPWPGGTLAALWSIDVRPDSFTEEFTARMPNRTERELLNMTVTGPVWDIVRVFLVGEHPVEVSRVIAPCARNTVYVEGPL